MSGITEQIKSMAAKINAAENLRVISKEGFVRPIEVFGGCPNMSEFRIQGNFRHGSGIEGSINQRMYEAQKRGLQMLENELNAEALCIIDEVLS